MIIIEFHGSTWHPNPEMSRENWSLWHNPKSKKTADDQYEFDMYKKTLAETNGFEYITVWDTEYKNEVVSRLKNIIDNKKAAK